MFKLSPSPLKPLDLRKEFAAAEAGAFACFEGWVRNHNDGKKVKALSYEAYEPLCRKEAKKVLKQAKNRFAVISAKCFHRIGDLTVGEIAVWVGVTAAHRDDAFKACRYIIDEVKARLPIWKKEHYENGDSGWVGCERCANHHHLFQTKK